MAIHPTYLKKKQQKKKPTHKSVPDSSDKESFRDHQVLHIFLLQGAEISAQIQQLRRCFNLNKRLTDLG